jgi:hypothetical protein
LIRHLWGILLFSMVACGDDTGTAQTDFCEVVDLPVAGNPNAPLVTDVTLEAQVGEGIVVLATATDPQGSDNLLNVFQTIRVFQDSRCDASPIVIQDDLAGSGVQESFGIAVPATNHALFATIAAAESWPVGVEFRDLDNNATSAQVLARVVH